MTHKRDGFVRLCHNNIDGILEDNSVNMGKASLIRRFLQQFKVDVFSMVELNANWKQVHGSQHIRELLRSENDMRCVVSHNVHENLSRVQYGGTGLVATGEVAAFVCSTGQDDSGLGRWSWMLFQGQNEVKTRVVSAYRPC